MVANRFWRDIALALCVGLVGVGLAILVSHFSHPVCRVDGSNCTDYQMQHGYSAVEPKN